MTTTTTVPSPIIDELAAATPRHRFRESVPLMLILFLQVLCTIRPSNTAFQDEALYLYAGHREVGQIFHGIPTYDNYASYFSGAPFLYPVAAAGVDGVAGLWGARLLSLAFLMTATWLLHGTTKRLFGRPAALGAAAVFAVSGPTLFVGHLATYDAPALCFLALGAWLVVATAKLPWPLIGLAAPALALAVATKYAALLYVPGIVLVGMLADPLLKPAARKWWGVLRPILRALLLVTAMAALIALMLRLAGHSFAAGVKTTTTQRAHGTDSVSEIVSSSVRWAGPLMIIAFAGFAVLPLTRRSAAPRSLRAMLALTLLGSGLLATAYQAHLHTLVSLQKHLDFGLWFAAPLAGVALSRLLEAGTRNTRRLCVALGVCLLIAGAGLETSTSLYRQWPDSARMVAVLRTQIRPVTGRYLVEEDEVPRYYLRNLTEPYQWTGTYFFTYKGQVGVTAYQAAIKDRYFDVVVLRYGPTAGLDHAIDSDLVGQHGYQLIAKVPYSSGYGSGVYFVWRAVH